MCGLLLNGISFFFFWGGGGGHDRFTLRLRLGIVQGMGYTQI